jgi:hypothetical protein
MCQRTSLQFGARVLLRKRITTYEGAQYAILGDADTLTGGALLPGLSVALGDWFAQVAG